MSLINTGKAPLKIELHRHLDVSVRAKTLHEFLVQDGWLPTSESLESFKSRLFIKSPMKNLETVLNQFGWFQKIWTTPDRCARVALECVEDCIQEGLDGAELRYSPSFMGDRSWDRSGRTPHLEWEVALRGFEQGLNDARLRFPDFKAGLICIASREFGPQAVDETVDFYLKNQKRFLGLDLAGNELAFPFEELQASFQKAIDAKARITIHAGEGTNPDQVWRAIELLGAQRIGHGIAAVQDPQLLDYLRSHGILLEMCPTSNWLTNCIQDIKDHPLPLALRAGVPVSINTDDPGIFDVKWMGEVELARNVMGLNQAELDLTFKNSERYSFF